MMGPERSFLNQRTDRIMLDGHGGLPFNQDGRSPMGKGNGQKSFLEGVGEFAQREWNEIQPLEPGTTQEHAFITGYILGCGCGMALSKKAPDMVKRMADAY